MFIIQMQTESRISEKNKYTKGCDGNVIKESFQEFRENRHLKLVGYVVKK